MNCEVARGAGDVSGRRQSLGDVLQAERHGPDPQGQADHQVALRAFECPAVTRVHVRLEGQDARNKFHFYFCRLIKQENTFLVFWVFFGGVFCEEVR